MCCDTGTTCGIETAHGAMQVNMASYMTSHNIVLHLVFYIAHLFTWLSYCPPAVLLENFSIFYSKGDTRLDHAMVKDFQESWYFFDEKAKVSEWVF